VSLTPRLALAALAAAGLSAAVPASASATSPGANGDVLCQMPVDNVYDAELFLVDPVSREQQRVPLDRPLLGGGSTPSLASDGRRIALSATPDPEEYAGDRDILLTDVAGAPTRNITNTPDVSEGTPVFSPSGLWMLFTTSRYDATTGSVTTELWRMRSDGSERRRIGLGEHPTWAPSGNRIAFVRDGAVHTADPWGGNLRRVAAGTRPSWSPDGSRLAWQRVEGDRAAIWTGTTTGAGARRVAWGQDPVWSPDGRFLAFLTTEEDAMGWPELVIARADGTDARNLDTFCESPDWQRLNRPPTAWFTATPSTPRVGQTVWLSSTSRDPDGPLARHAWDLDGDGAFDDGTATSARRVVRSGERSVTIRLRVVDRDGAAAVARRTLTVAR